MRIPVLDSRLPIASLRRELRYTLVRLRQRSWSKSWVTVFEGLLKETETVEVVWRKIERPLHRLARRFPLTRREQHLGAAAPGSGILGATARLRLGQADGRGMLSEVARHRRPMRTILEVHQHPGFSEPRQRRRRAIVSPRSPIAPCAVAFGPVTDTRIASSPTIAPSGRTVSSPAPGTST